MLRLRMTAAHERAKRRSSVSFTNGLLAALQTGQMSVGVTMGKVSR